MGGTVALKPTIYKCNLTISDFDRDYYDSVNLTIAQHPSESLERMMTRVLAYALNGAEHLTFTKGLSTPDEPDVWLKSLDDQLLLWIDVGEPASDRIKKASRLARQVKVYSFNSKSDVWWEQERSNFKDLNAEIHQFKWEKVKLLAELVNRTMDCMITINEGNLSIVIGDNEAVDVAVSTLQKIA